MSHLAFRKLALRHLRLIDAIARLGQLNLAAERLRITQPAASRTLAEAERLLGAPLFERHARGMSPTGLGEVVVAHASAIVHRLDQAGVEIEAWRSGHAGRIDIGTVTGPAVAYVVPAILELRAEAPRAGVGIDVAPSAELAAGLLRGDYDLVVGRVPEGIDPRQFEILSGRVEEVVLMAHASHPLATAPQPVPLEALRGFPWVMQRAGMPIRVAIEQAYMSRGLTPPPDVIDTASLLVSMALLSETQALAPVTREVAGLLEGFRNDGLRTIRTRPEIVLSPYHILRLRDREPSPLARRFLGILTGKLAPPRG
ncbi:DNA-binding transcriptional regulator, LysR family [Meinhardsimonia xiamenensis]|jgi:DNA-binding transcriptional LysR family regulator|uniref:DNA-binding transcriptional regulator, LysR family n=1 Tax=Meinhardsimonia xiamenensis TaxID=990712 RepID=A0A1G9FI93_9RHOB|nr:LysR substrate-binding domain-containing protein [Meinhardsimonia xiamenensis]PRX37832.1 DNA-binding transcriptional LysR family regulator [Meinhardsimonia xiamenensis]SDK88118.1 DNA-binding transcriptional regulator, LysR family [Meinhardsimonia xiamenensis]